VETANVVEPAVIGFADERVGAGNIFVSVFGDRPMGDSGCGVKNAEGVGQDDRSFDLAEFVDLSGADEFAEGVVGEDGAGDFVLKKIAGMRTNGGDAGADVVAFDDGHLADEDAGNVGDGVFGPGIVEAEG